MKINWNFECCQETNLINYHKLVYFNWIVEIELCNNDLTWNRQTLLVLQIHSINAISFCRWISARFRFSPCTNCTITDAYQRFDKNKRVFIKNGRLLFRFDRHYVRVISAPRVVVIFSYFFFVFCYIEHTHTHTVPTHPYRHDTTIICTKTIPFKSIPTIISFEHCVLVAGSSSLSSFIFLRSHN